MTIALNAVPGLSLKVFSQLLTLDLAMAQECDEQSDEEDDEGEC